MRNLTKYAILMVLTMFLVSSIAQSNQKFKVYGFADMYIGKLIMDDQNLLREQALTDRVSFSLSHLNIYSDWNPNPYTRALAEVRYTNLPHGRNFAPKNILITDIDTVLGMSALFPGVHDTTIMDAGKEPTDNTIIDGAASSYIMGSIIIERAWFDLMISDLINLRFGKFITPVGIWNVDHGSPAILTVRQPYQISLTPLFPQSLTGIMGYGATYFGDYDLNYKLYMSNGRELANDNGQFPQMESLGDMGVGFNSKITLPYLDDFKIGMSAYTGLIRDIRDVHEYRANPTLTATELQDAMLDGSGDSLNPADSAGLAQIGANVEALVTAKVGAEAANLDNHYFVTEKKYESRELGLGLDLKATFKNITLQSEVNYQKLTNRLENDTTSSVLGYYGLISYKYRLSKNVNISPYFMFENVSADSPGANERVTKFSDHFMGGYTTLLAGLNIKLYTNTTIKLEWGKIDLDMQGDYANNNDQFNLQVVNAQFGVAF